MKKLLIGLTFIIVLASSVMAAWIQPVDCDSLFNDQFIPSINFDEPADICFYGSDYHVETVEVSLSGENSYVLADVIITNGVLSSIADGSRNYFEDVVCGEYTLRVRSDECEKEYSATVVVNCDDDDDDDDGPTDEVPEFSTLAALAVLIGSGLYIKTKRRKLK